jgi:hypothetical protein
MMLFARSVCSLVLCLLVLMMTTVESYNKTCQEIKQEFPNSPSGLYYIYMKDINDDDQDFPSIEVYCEMGLNGGGYTFIHPFELQHLTDRDIQRIFKDKTSFLMRIRRTDGTQPYAVLSQLKQFSSIPLMVGLDHNTNYKDPINKKILSEQYLYFGFLPMDKANRKSVQQGITANNYPITYTNCNGNPNNYIALFPNYKEITPSNYTTGQTAWCRHLFTRHRLNPSGRVMPTDYFMFGELHFGGCGCYTHTNRHQGLLSAAIGFR